MSESRMGKEEGGEGGREGGRNRERERGSFIDLAQ